MVGDVREFDGQKILQPWAVYRLIGQIEVIGFVNAFRLLNVGRTSELQKFKLAELDQSARRDRNFGNCEAFQSMICLLWCQVESSNKRV